MRLPFPGVPPLPGPGDVLDGAAALRHGISAALELVPRAAAALDRVEALLDRLEQTADRTDGLLARTDATVTRADAVLASAEVAVARSQRTLDVAEISVRDSGRAVEAAGATLDRVDAMMRSWEAPLRKLAPAAERFAEALDPSEVTAAISLVDRMPQLLDHVENDVLPMLTQLDRVGPDVHELLEVVEDLRRVLTGLPGIGLLRRRGDDEPPPIEGSVHDDNRVVDVDEMRDKAGSGRRTRDR